MAETINLHSEYDRALDKTVSALKGGNLAIFPTDTVYGIGADCASESAMRKLYAAKKRDEKKPVAVLMASLGMIREWCDISHYQSLMLMEHLPGPYTFILKLREGKSIMGLEGKIGVRVPLHSFAKLLPSRLGSPVAATSANLSGGADPTDFKLINREILSSAEVAIDGGACAHKKPSTVVDLVDKKILRQGAGKFEF
jgi:L-threonylcarbamoyladenylate synthase